MEDLKKKDDNFSNRIDDIVRDGCAALGLTVGQKVGLFAFAAQLKQPFTAEELAESSNCKKGCLKQWLLQMASAKIFEVDDADGLKFRFTKENADTLLRPTSLVVNTSNFLPYFNAQYEDLVSCFKKDGPPEMEMKQLTDTGDIWGEWQRSRSTCFEHYLPVCITHHNGLMEKLEKGCKMLDIGANDGRMISMLAKQFPNSSFVGSDINQKAMEKADQNAKTNGQNNLSFTTADAMNLPEDWTSTFDYVTIIDAFSHMANRSKAAKEMKRILKPGGHLTVIEIPRGDNYREDIKMPNAVVTYTFGMLFSCMGCEDEEAGGDNSGGNSADSAKESDDAHCSAEDRGLEESLTSLLGNLKSGDFENVQVADLPKIDVDDAVHLFATKAIS